MRGPEQVETILDEAEVREPLAEIREAGSARIEPRGVQPFKVLEGGNRRPGKRAAGEPQDNRILRGFLAEFG